MSDGSGTVAAVDLGATSGRVMHARVGPGTLELTEAARFLNTPVRVWEGDAVPVLRALPEGCLDEVRLFFPDPWPKARHAKRRLLRPSFVALLDRVLAPDGVLHLATDWPAYAEHAQEALAGWSCVEDRRGRPVTGYERRAHRDGREAVDLVCTRQAGWSSSAS